jgi:hypothetical protein
MAALAAFALSFWLAISIEVNEHSEPHAGHCRKHGDHGNEKTYT